MRAFMIQLGKVYRICPENDHPINNGKFEGLAYITSGSFYGGHQNRISNFWHWRKVLADGSLSKEDYAGYGGDWEPVECEVETCIRIPRGQPDVFPGDICPVCGARQLEFHKTNCSVIEGRKWDR